MILPHNEATGSNSLPMGVPAVIYSDSNIHSSLLIVYAPKENPNWSEDNARFAVVVVSKQSVVPN